MSVEDREAEPKVALHFGTPAGRWVIVAAVLGSGIAFLDSTVVNIALPAIRRDLGGGLAGLQWTIDAYLLTLGSLLIFGGSLGDMYGRRRIFITGLIGFSLASLLCGISPSVPTLIAARGLQGIAGALLVPTSLALISSTFETGDRAQAIGSWSGWSGVTTAVGPFIGGYFVDAVSWRLVFLINLPVAAAAVILALKYVPETRDLKSSRKPDLSGAALAALALGGAVFALIEGPSRGMNEPIIATAVILAALAAVAFVVVERRVAAPMLPLTIFASRQFSGANLVTLLVYAALSGSMFFLSLQLQEELGYSAVEAGSAFIPITLLLLFLSSRAGRLSQRIGPRWPMTAGPIVVGAGLFMMMRIEPGATYWGAVFPSAVVMGLGLALTVSPLTAAVLAAVEDEHAGLGSGINNAVARLAGLIAIAVVPFLAGLRGDASVDLTTGFQRAILICAFACVLGGLVALATIRQSVGLRNVIHPDIAHPCNDARDPAA